MLASKLPDICISRKQAVKVTCTWTVQSYSPGCANVYHHLTHASLDPPESTRQTASRSVQPFLQSSRQAVLILHWAAPLIPPQSCPFAAWSGPHLIHGSLSHRSPQPKRHLDRFSRFCTAHYCDRQTDRSGYSVCNNRPHLRAWYCDKA